MPAKSSSPEIQLRRGWSSEVKSAILHVVSPAQFALEYTGALIYRLERRLSFVASEFHASMRMIDSFGA